jgi:hypothetical protein
VKGQETSGIIGSLSIIPHPEGCPRASHQQTAATRTAKEEDDSGSVAETEKAGGGTHTLQRKATLIKVAEEEKEKAMEEIEKMP